MKRFLQILLFAMLATPLAVAGAAFIGMDKTGLGTLIAHFSGTTGDVKVPTYNEGTGVITLIGSSNSVTMAGVTSVNSNFIRVGKMVMFNGKATTTGAGSATGAVQFQFGTNVPPWDSTTWSQCSVYTDQATLPVNSTTTAAGMVGCRMTTGSSSQPSCLWSMGRSAAGDLSILASSQTQGGATAWNVSCTYFTTSVSP